MEISKQDLIEAISEELVLSKKTVKSVIDNLLEKIETETQIGNSVTLKGYFTVKPVVRQARQGRNPKTGEVVQIPEKRTVAFKVGSKLKG